MPTLTLDVKYKIGDIVYLKTDAEQLPRIVIAYFTEGREEDVMYKVIQETDTSFHYNFELQAEKNKNLFEKIVAGFTNKS